MFLFSHDFPMAIAKALQNDGVHLGQGLAVLATDVVHLGDKSDVVGHGDDSIVNGYMYMDHCYLCMYIYIYGCVNIYIYTIYI